MNEPRLVFMAPSGNTARVEFTFTTEGVQFALIWAGPQQPGDVEAFTKLSVSLVHGIAKHFATVAGVTLEEVTFKKGETFGYRIKGEA